MREFRRVTIVVFTRRQVDLSDLSAFDLPTFADCTTDDCAGFSADGAFDFGGVEQYSSRLTTPGADGELPARVGIVDAEDLRIAARLKSSTARATSPAASLQLTRCASPSPVTAILVVSVIRCVHLCLIMPFLGRMPIPPSAVPLAVDAMIAPAVPVSVRRRR